MPPAEFHELPELPELPKLLKLLKENILIFQAGGNTTDYIILLDPNYIVILFLFNSNNDLHSGILFNYIIGIFLSFELLDAATPDFAPPIAPII